MTLRRNYNDNITQHLPIRSHPNPSQQDYQILLEFDLKRQKQKNLILQQRLKNKQVFIQQMKHFQQQLTIAYQQCKSQLILAQQKIQYLQNVQFRQYTEQITDLKHMLLLKSQQSKRNSIGKDDRIPFSAINNRVNKNKSEKGLNNKNTERRQSKTSSYYATRRQRSEQNKLESQVSKEFKKSVNFIAHFLQMAECYLIQLKEDNKLTKKLKKSWKWIKDVVKEWDSLKQRSISYKYFIQKLSVLFGAQKDVDLTILFEIIKNEKQKNQL